MRPVVRFRYTDGELPLGPDRPTEIHKPDRRPTFRSLFHVSERERQLDLSPGAQSGLERERE